MKKIIILTLCTLMTFNAVNAQKALIKKGDDCYKMYAFASAITYYEKALKKDSMQQDAIFKLANCYRLINNRERAEFLYGRAVTLPNCEPISDMAYLMCK